MTTSLLSVFVATAMANPRQETLVREFDVEPDTGYQLSFNARTHGKGVSWVLRIFNGRGELPHAGCHRHPWQTIAPDRQRYQHSFFTPRDGLRLHVVGRYQNAPPAFSDIKLEKLRAAALVINGDFSGGRFDYSGWNERSKATLLEQEGETVLHIKQNGYALSDPVPVIPGGGYRYAPGSSRASQIFAYDAHRHFVSVVPYHHNKQPVLEMPENAAYLRFLFKTSWEHIPTYRTNTVKRLEIVQQGTEARPTAPAAARADAEIVLSPECDPREHHAARELQHWLGRVTGKAMPVLGSPSTASRAKIFVGTHWAGAFADDLDYLAGSDGFAVRSEDENIYIFGARPAGTHFGVFRFLEANTDIIWARPNPEFGAVFSSQPDLAFTETDFRSRPAFPMRTLSFPGGMPDLVSLQAWMGRNGTNTAFKLQTGFDYCRWLQGAQTRVGGGFVGAFLGLERPEDYYPLVNGRRMVDVWANPCFTNPDVVQAIVDSARRKLTAAPGGTVDYLVCRVADNWRVCSCSGCMRPIILADGNVLSPKSQYADRDPQFFSTRLFMVLNQVAQDLVKDYPNLSIVTHAYIFTAEPPMVDVHPAIIAQFAAYPTRNLRIPLLKLDDKGGKVWKARFRRWAELKKKGLGFFGYYYAGGFNAVADTAAADLAALAGFGGSYAHSEGYCTDVETPSPRAGKRPFSHAWDYAAAEKWLTARLMWDPTQDVGELRRYYIKRTYREAAPAMQQFYDLVGSSWHNPQNKTFVNCHSTAQALFESLIVTPGLEAEARRLLETAVGKAKHPNSRRMSRRMLARFEEVAQSLGRVRIPAVTEATHDWQDAISPHWEKAAAVHNFKQVIKWRVPEGDRPARRKTEVRMMRDQSNLFLRFAACDDSPQETVGPAKSPDERFPNGDRVEVFLKTDGVIHFFAVGPRGNRYDARHWNVYGNWNSSWQVKTATDAKSWTALVAIPLADLELTPGKTTVKARFARVYRPGSPQREDSTSNGYGMFNFHESLWTPLIFE